MFRQVLQGGLFVTTTKINLSMEKVELFVRGQTNGVTLSDDQSEEETVQDGLWDDEILIKAYEKAVSISTEGKESNEKEKDYKDRSTKKQTKSKGSKKQQGEVVWTVNKPCSAIYSADQKLYEATVLRVNEDQKKCRVRFIGYNNEEEVSFDDMFKSNGEDARIQQALTAQEELTNAENAFEMPKWEEVVKKPVNDFIPLKESGIEGPLLGIGGPLLLPPPLPPSAIKAPKSEQQAFSSMLMSWYMAGYHTGLYQGMKYAERKITAKK